MTDTKNKDKRGFPIKAFGNDKATADYWSKPAMTATTKGRSQTENLWDDRKKEKGLVE